MTPPSPTHYPFLHDRRKAGRDLESVKVGDVYISRLTIEPGVLTGNVYHKATKVLLFVTEGTVNFRFVQVNTGEKKEMELGASGGAVHIPTYVAIASKNVGQEKAVVIYFSNLPFRGDDDYEYKIY